MATFRDNSNRDWVLSLNVRKISEIRERFQLDLVDEGQSYERMAGDPCLLVNVLWYLCEQQANTIHKGIDTEGFAEALVGDAIDRAVEAMLEAIANFSQKSKRDLLKAIAAKNARIRDLGMAKALERINDPDLEAKAVAALEERMDAELRSALTRLSNATSSPDSAESSPTSEPSAS